MPISELRDSGFLPEGIHDCSLAELRQRFGSFQSTDQRPNLYRQFEEFVEELRTLGIRLTILVNGSFVTSHPKPNDIDLILVLPPHWNFRVELKPNEYNLLSKRRVKRRWRLDMLVAV